MASWFKEMIDTAEKTADDLKVEEITQLRKEMKRLDARVHRRKQKMRNMAELPEEERRQLAEKTMISLDALRQELLALGEKICAL